MKKQIIQIEGMHCASCAIQLEKGFSKLTGVKKVMVNFATQKASVEYDEVQIKNTDLDKLVVDMGYQVSDGKTGHQHDHKKKISEKKLKYRVLIAIVLTLPVFIRMFWPWELPGSFLGISITNWAQHDLAFLVVFILGWTFHSGAFKQLKKGRANMDTLISLGTLSAYFYSLYAMFAHEHLYFESATTITSLILLGKFLELKTKNRASQAMQKLMELGVKKARVIKNGEQIEMEIDQVKINDVVLVKPGEKIPLDGLVIEGQSTIDESVLTGESLPIDKEPGHEVYGATINKDGVLQIKVTKTNDQTMLTQIIKTVEQSQAFKAPMQRLADQIAGIFVPVVIGIAFLTFLDWWLIADNLAAGIINAVTVLIISCPCALGIATPMAVMVGGSVGARKGILVKDGESFEKARKIDVVIFDKTGTLTEGQPVVQKVLVNEKYDFSENKIIKISASLAEHSNHPLSQAVGRLGQSQKIDLAEVVDFKEVSGKGVQGRCKQHQTDLLLGNNKLLMSERSLDTDWVDRVLVDNKQNGSSILFVVHGKNVIGALMLVDEIKNTSKQTISELKSMDLQPFMISGDNRNTAKTVATQLGIDNYLAEVLPADKQEEVKKMQDQGKKVVFVGDGINDAPALIQSDLGIAMGSGADIARESGDIIIMNSDPLTVVEAIKLSRKTFGIIKQNLFWAFFYNILAIPLAVFGVATPMIGALAMSLSDVAVIGNSLRIYRE
ncbi:MAG: heavy metal translocating P-type ATPase [bacterium]